jgi:hypothetical protein
MAATEKPAPAPASGGGGMEMPRWLDALGGLIDRTAGFWQKLGDLESSANRAELDATPRAAPGAPWTVRSRSARRRA